MKPSVSFSLPIFAVSLVLGGCPGDRVSFTNRDSTGDIGILLDGRIGGADVNDQSFTTGPTGDVRPGFVSAGAHNEIVAYQSRRPTALVQNVGWTSDRDAINVPFSNEMGARFYVWLLQGPASDRQAQAIAGCVRLDQIWRDERMGARIATFQITDRTGSAASAPFLDFTCAEAATMRSQIGHNNNGVNIYYVNRVDFGSGFSTGNGVWCGNNTIVMGSAASDHLSAHEVGHAFAMDHVNALTTNFDTTNVMHNASNNRRFQTEGQTFRAHLTPASVINTTFNFRPGLPTRACASLSETATAECPAIQKRIWADGTFPPN